LEVTIIESSITTIDDSFKQNVSVCASWPIMSILQISSALLFLRPNREMMKVLKQSTLLQSVSPYHDFALDAKDFPKLTSMMALLCAKLGADVDSSSSSSSYKIFLRAKGLRPQLSQNPSSVNFTPDGTTLNCYSTDTKHLFDFYLRTCYGSSLKQTILRVEIPGAFSYKEIPMNPFQKEKQMISFCNAQRNPFCAFEISHEGLTSVHEPVPAYDYMHSSLPVRAILCAGDTVRPNGRHLVEGSKVSLFHKDSMQPFAIYSLEKGCICFNGKSLTGKSHESWKRYPISLMKFSIQGPMFVLIIGYHMIFINFDTQKTTIQKVGSSVMFHDRLPLFWTVCLPDPCGRRRCKPCMWLIDPSFSKAELIAWR
jgi:hypothetical protein